MTIPSSPSSVSLTNNGDGTFTVRVYDPNSSMYIDGYLDICDYQIDTSNGGWHMWKDWTSYSGSVWSTTGYFTGWPQSQLDNLQFRARLRDRNNPNDWSGWTYSNTIANPNRVSPSPPTGISISLSGLNVTVYFTKGINATTTWLDLYDYGGTSDYSTSGSSISFSVGSYGTTYQFDMRSQNGYGYSGWTSTYSFTPTQPAPAPTNPNWTKSGTTIYAAADYHPEIGTVAWDKSINGGTWYGSDIYSGAEMYHDVSTLSDGGTVQFRARYINVTSGYTQSNSWAYTVTYKKTPAPASCSWYESSGYIYASGSGNSTYGTLSYDISVNGGGWLGGSSYNLASLAEGGTVQFRARYNPTANGYTVVDSTDPFGWTYSSIYTKNTRPAYFSWTTQPNASGSAVNITAVDWNALTTNINAVRQYKSNSQVAFTFVKGISNGYSKAQSTLISAAIFNEARSAVNNVGYSRSLVNQGGSVHPTDFTNLANDINNVS